MAAFTPAGSGGLTPTVNIPGITKQLPDITTLVVGVVEVTVVLPLDTAAFQLRSRGNRPLYVATSSGGPQFTIDPGCIWTEWSINQPSAITIYITSPASSMVELLTWEK